MAVNALGQTLQLLLNQAPNNDLSLGLKAGDLLKGRILDVLPDNRAIIQIKGYNMLAQLPQAQPGQQFSKGVLLDLAVLQAQPKPSQPLQAPGQPQAQPGAAVASSQPAAPQAPALTVKLLGISAQQELTGQIRQAGIDQAASPLPQPSLEALLAQARLPVNSANLQAAESLIRYGLPVDAQSLHGVVHAADALIAAEGQSLPEPQAPALPAPVIQSLNEAKTLLNLVASQPQRITERPQIQELIRQIDQLLSPQPESVENNPASAPVPADDLPALPQAPAPALKSWAEAAPRIQSALNQVSDGKSQALQNLAGTLDALKAAASQLPPEAPEAVHSNNAPTAPTAPRPAELPAFASMKREAAALIGRELAPLLAQGKAGQTELMAAIDQLSAELEAPQSPRQESILASVSIQQGQGAEMPQSPAVLLRQAVAEIKQAFSSAPLPRPLRSAEALASEFEARGIPAPRVALSSLPREVVVEAVAFLKARQIPLSRPAVEAVASQLSEGADLGTQINAILDSEAALPQGLTDLQPQLRREFTALREFLDQNGIRPEARDLAGQIREFVFKSGHTLERDLARLSGALPEPMVPESGPAPSPMADPSDTLKAGLLRLREAVHQASRHAVAQASPELSAKLEEIGAHISSAVNAMNTLQMASNPTPAFDVNSFQIPVFFGGQLQSGQLSIYWKRGRPKELNSEDPANIFFLLNTRGLGEVKVQLQVWKEECRCRVSVGDEETRKFIEAESAGLQQTFSDNTPFRLSSLDIQGALAPLKRALDFVEDAAQRSGAMPGLNLTA